MAKGKRRRSTAWRRSNDGLAHAFQSPSATSVCRSFQLTQTTNVDVARDGPTERCRPCEIAIDQQW